MHFYFFDNYNSFLFQDSPKRATDPIEDSKNKSDPKSNTVKLFKTSGGKSFNLSFLCNLSI